MLEKETFTVARHYRLQVANIKDETNPLTLATPIAHRTRSRELSRKLADMPLGTPSKSNNISETQFGAKKYLWGNVPALDVLQLESNEGKTGWRPAHIVCRYVLVLVEYLC